MQKDYEVVEVVEVVKGRKGKSVCTEYGVWSGGQ